MPATAPLPPSEAPDPQELAHLERSALEAIERKDAWAAVLAVTALRDLGEPAFPTLARLLSLDDTEEYDVYALARGPGFAIWCLDHAELPKRLRKNAVFVLPFLDPRLLPSRTSARAILAEPDADVAERLVGALGNLTGERTIGDLSQVAAQAASVKVRRQALFELTRRSEATEALQAISRMSAVDLDPDLRRLAREALGNTYGAPR